MILIVIIEVDFRDDFVIIIIKSVIVLIDVMIRHSHCLIFFLIKLNFTDRFYLFVLFIQVSS